MLVDGGEHETYVAERHLEASTDPALVVHPEVKRLFSAYLDGVYHRRTH